MSETKYEILPNNTVAEVVTTPVQENVAADNIKADILNEPSIKDLGSIQEIKSISNPANLQGITYENTIKKVDGKTINPYKDVNPNKNAVVELYETIGGSDLSLYMLLEVPAPEDIGLPPDIQKKEIMTIEMDNALSMSYSIMRERFPVRAMNGSSNPKSYTKGPRTIAGHIAFAVFTKDVLQYLRSRISQEIQQVETNFSDYEPESSNAKYDSMSKYNKWLNEKYTYSNVLNNKVQLLDDLPPFHILCMGTNENGIFSKLLIKNVHIIDENQYQGTQQPNIINKVSWVSEDIIPMNEVEKWNQKTVLVSSINSIESAYYNGNYSGNIHYNYEVTGSSLVDELKQNTGGK